MIKHDEYSESNSISVHHAENQDSLLVDEDHLAFAVADGVGGYEGGKVASSLAVEILRKKMKGISDEEELRSCIQELHSTMLARAAELGYPLMGTTLAVSKIFENEEKILSANVGDSPIFMIRSGDVIQLYHDDSQRFANPRNMWALTQYLGFGPESLLVHSKTTAYREGDIVVLCSDGVSDNILGPDVNLGFFGELVTKTRSAREIVKKAIMTNLKRDDMSAIFLFL
ncbi:MAG: PP2C family protein-serine/threonine phosphatase [Nitrososphaerales archaeon]